MADSISSTSPTSPSTFSFAATSTPGSHYTSEEQPDLGAGFRTVLRELTYLQPPPRIPTYNHNYNSQFQSIQSLQSLSQTEEGRRSTVWAYGPIAQYLVDEDDTEAETDTDTTRSVHIETETEIEHSASSTASPTATTSLVDDYTLTLRTQPSPPASASLDREFEFDLEHGYNNFTRNLDYDHERESGPSLGYLDQALSFIAAERAQLAARTSAQSDAWRQVVDSPSNKTRRKRRKRNPKPTSLLKVSIEDEEQSYPEPESVSEDEDAEGDDEQSPYYDSSQSKYQSKSTPLTPRPRSPTSSPAYRTPTLTPSFNLPQSQVSVLSSSDSPLTSSTPGGTKRPPRKRTRTKNRKASVPSTSAAAFVYPSSSVHPHSHMPTHARSVPSLRTLHVQHAVKDKEGPGIDVTGLETIDHPTRKLISLARYLARISPDDWGALEGVERKMLVRALRRARAGEGLTKGIRKENGKQEEGEREEGQEEEEEDEEDVLDPRGRAPRKGDPPIHVFIDHYLKRHPHLTTSSELKNRNRNTGNINFRQDTKNNDNANHRSQFRINISSNNWDTTVETKEKEQTMKDKEKMVMMTKEKEKEEKEKTREKEIIVPRILTRPTATSTTTNANTKANTNKNTPISTNPTSTSTLAATSLPTPPTQTEHTTPIPLPSFATALSVSRSRDAISNPNASAASTGVASKGLPDMKPTTTVSTINTGITPTSSPTKTRTRSRSRKARKAAQAQHAVVDDWDRDVVLFGDRRSLRQAGVGRASEGAGVGVEDGYEMKGEDGEGDELDFEHEETGTGTGESGRESGSGSGPGPGGGGHGQGQGEGQKESYEEDVDEDEEVQIEKKGTGTGANTRSSVKQRQKQRHLSHTALALILERGRAVSRRVVVTSSPLYQPMNTLERLGYEVRVYIRVPDLGDGMDRTAKKKPHKRHLSGGTTSGGDTVSGSPGTSPLKPTLSTNFNSTTPATPTTPMRVRYREQGVDELLQLKLHQVLAATDDVPPGATIVLATGDGNVGQFSEDGFLGPVRTALKRGWRVELYAWEEGLSRAWRREFGLGSEWARNGTFQIIGMEQFAASLIKGGL
ncbi:hypothetical protein C0995_009019 [Termitomyces sp. Mi166|nr:hypothetical protein C0995_009019 [Termitomyces sp. Mi166\